MTMAIGDRNFTEFATLLAGRANVSSNVAIYL